MKRSTLISVVDVTALVLFILLISTGALMRYELPPGSGRIEMPEGAGWRAAQRPVAVVWGLSRHEWGDLHFWFSVGFLAAIAVHLFIHWKWIAVSFKGENKWATRMQAGLGILALLALLIFAIAPFLSPKRELPRSAWQTQNGESIQERPSPSDDATPGVGRPLRQRKGQR